LQLRGFWDISFSPNSVRRADAARVPVPALIASAVVVVVEALRVLSEVAAAILTALVPIAVAVLHANAARRSEQQIPRVSSCWLYSIREIGTNRRSILCCTLMSQAILIYIFLIY